MPITEITNTEITVNDNNTERTFFVDATVKWYTERNYGADADGNRGVSRDFIDDITYNGIRERTEDGEIPVNYKDLSPTVQESIDDFVAEIE